MGLGNGRYYSAYYGWGFIGLAVAARIGHPHPYPSI